MQHLHAPNSAQPTTRGMLDDTTALLLLFMQRQLLAWQLLRELTVHILAEEAVVYPVVAEKV